ncbi:MAG: hypothetical protein ACP5C4_06390 [Methanomicrobiales archaeon]
MTMAGCAIPPFSIESGIPAMGLGLLLLIFVLVPFLLPTIPALPAPAAVAMVIGGIVFFAAGLRSELRQRRP